MRPEWEIVSCFDVPVAPGRRRNQQLHLIRLWKSQSVGGLEALPAKPRFSDLQVTGGVSALSEYPKSTRDWDVHEAHENTSVGSLMLTAGTPESCETNWIS